MQVIESLLLLFVRYAFALRLLAVAMMGTMIQTGVVGYMVHFLGRWYMEGVFLGFICSVTACYFLEKRFLFRKEQGVNEKHRFPLFCLVTMAGLGETILLMYVLVNLLSVWYLAAEVLTTILVFIVNYFINRHLTFAHHH